jgi:polysaccharide chain length determinant protein (PEP-CTERM system associated)
MVAGTAATVAIVSRLRPIYESAALIVVESQKIPEQFVASTVQTVLEARLDTLKQQVLSYDRLWGLIQALNLYPEERGRLSNEEVVQLMRTDINIALVRGWSARGPGAFKVEYRSPRADITAEVANRVGMFFVNENLRQRTVEATATSEFLDQQLQDAEKRLREQEAKLKEFKLTHNGELPQQEAALLAIVSQGRTEMLGIQESLGRAQQNKIILESSLAHAEATLRNRIDSSRQRAAAAGIPLGAVDAGQPRLTELERAEIQLESLRARYQEAHPELQRAKAEYERLRRAAAATPPADAATAKDAESGPAAPEDVVATGADADAIQAESNRVQDLRAQIAAVAKDIQILESRRERVLRDVEDGQGRLSSLPVREQQLAVITRDYDTSKANYDSLLNKKMAADVAANMERWQKSEKFVVLDPARVPQKPSGKRNIILTIAGGLLSLCIGAAAGFGLELRKNVVLGEWELPAGIAVLGRIPVLDTESR